MQASSPAVLVLGAPGTGVVALAQALRACLRSRPVRVVDHEVSAEAPSPPASAEGIDGVLTAVARGAVATLLLGTDLPCAAEGEAMRAEADARLRTQLAAAGLGYQVVYGLGDARLAHALRALATTISIATDAYPVSAKADFDPKRRRADDRPVPLKAWVCEKCSDPECERRLFTALVAQNATGDR